MVSTTQVAGQVQVIAVIMLRIELNARFRPFNAKTPVAPQTPTSSPISVRISPGRRGTVRTDLQNLTVDVTLGDPATCLRTLSLRLRFRGRFEMPG